jgi:hypothetical protein
MVLNNTDIIGSLDFSIDDISGTMNASGQFIDIDLYQIKTFRNPFAEILPSVKMSVNAVGKALTDRGLTVRVCSENRILFTVGHKAQPNLLNRLGGTPNVEFKLTWNLVRLFFLAKRK